MRQGGLTARDGPDQHRPGFLVFLASKLGPGVLLHENLSLNHYFAVKPRQGKFRAAMATL